LAGPLSAAPARERAPPPPEFFAIRRRLADAKDAPARIELLTELSKAGKAESAPDLLAAMDASDARVRERAAVLLGDVGASDAWAKEATAPASADPAAARVIAYLESPAFAEAERIAGRAVGPRNLTAPGSAPLR